MENASKALIMAAEILIGVIIISIGVALFTIFSGYSKETVEEIAETQIAEFNSNFLKYEGHAVTAHEIITVANYARQNNMKYDDFVKPDNTPRTDLKANEASYYIQVIVSNIDKNLIKNTFDPNHFEYATEEEKNAFLKAYSVDGAEQVTFESKATISPITKKVYKIEFKKNN